MLVEETITDEVRKVTDDIIKNTGRGRPEKVVKLIDELTPKLKEGVINYVERWISYISGWSDTDSEKKGKLLHLKIIKLFLDIDTYENPKLTYGGIR